VTWFCLTCFAQLPKTAETCVRCGADQAGSDRDFEAALVAALQHPLHDRRLLAARVIGRRRAVTAVSALISVAEDARDPYLAAEAARALVAIGTAEGMAVVRRLARDGPVVARSAAREALGGAPSRQASAATGNVCPVTCAAVAVSWEPPIVTK
jgi:HEAT repeats